MCCCACCGPGGGHRGFARHGRHGHWAGYYPSREERAEALENYIDDLKRELKALREE